MGREADLLKAWQLRSCLRFAAPVCCVDMCENGRALPADMGGGSCPTMADIFCSLAAGAWAQVAAPMESVFGFKSGQIRAFQTVATTGLSLHSIFACNGFACAALLDRCCRHKSAMARQRVQMRSPSSG